MTRYADDMVILCYKCAGSRTSTQNSAPMDATGKSAATPRKETSSQSESRMREIRTSGSEGGELAYSCSGIKHCCKLKLHP